MKIEARNVKLPTYLSPNEVVLPRGHTQHIRCPSYIKGERVSLVFWFKGEQLLARYTHPKVGSSYAWSDRYRMSYSHDLVISHFDLQDQGEYVCSVVPSATGLQRRQLVSVTVLTDVPSFKEAMYNTTSDAYVQRNKTYHIQCPSYREGESVSLVFWFKGGQLITRFANPAVGTNFISSRHYWMSSSHGLVINRVQAADDGDYMCGVVPTATGVQRKGSVRVTVLGPKFPIVDDALYVNTGLILERGQGHVTMTCPALRMDQQAATVYWSLGNEETMDTSIIGVKFSDGEAMVSDDYRGDYNITDGGSLVLNTLDMPTSRFWCHVFTDQPGLFCAYYDITKTVPCSTTESATSGKVGRSDEIIPQESDIFQGKAPYDSIALSTAKLPDGPYIVPVACLLTVLIMFILVKGDIRNEDAESGMQTQGNK
ncbi:uncharacterized protein LOC119729291 [Patiria miniata]|uniref:Ig-like domain-containing protein n=1 Tax=Patiria miniata TaxID=46514 RepID=A0A914A3B9_PATMI|nr:uncharacterized protein LOC119729291 [Patiria miniata]